MKKMIGVAVVLTALLNGVAFAETHIKAGGPAATFAPVNWTSKNQQDQITVEHSAGTNNSYYAVQISVFANVGMEPAAGINLFGCGTINHVAAGSTAICELNPQNRVITFSSDNYSRPAMGYVQIETK